jgi:integrase
MAFAGLRIGEAVALSKADSKRNGDLCWIDVSLSRQNLKGRYKKPKSGQGRVVIPEWLYEKLQKFDYPEILPNSLYKWMKRRGLQPHGLRHFYATYLVRNVSNPELARRQLRHANLETTLGTYVEITSMDEMAAVSGLQNPFEAA